MKTVISALFAMTVCAGAACAGAPNYCPPVGCFPDAGPVAAPVAYQPPVMAPAPPAYPGFGLAPAVQTSLQPMGQVSQVTRMVPVEREVTVPEGRWVLDRRVIPCTRTEYVNEPYTAYEARYERRPETRMRRVTRTVRETERRTVNETVYESYCDPVTGRTCRVPRTVSRTVEVPVRRRVCVEEPYTVNVRHRVMVPVTKTRRVARSVPSTREVTERRWVTEMVRRKVCVMEPVVQTCTVQPVGAGAI